MHTLYAAVADVGAHSEDNTETAVNQLEGAFGSYTVDVVADSVEIYAAADRSMALAPLTVPDDVSPTDLSQVSGNGIAVARDKDSLDDFLNHLRSYDRVCFAKLSVRGLSPSPVRCRGK